MALPADVTEAYLQGSHPEIQKFWRTVAARAPEDIQSRVSEFTSQVSDEKCIFRDRHGVVLHETPDPPPPVKTKSSYAPSQSGMQVQALGKQVAQSRQLGLSNAQAVVQLAETLTGLIERLNQLVPQVDGMQKRIDSERRGIVFRGAWQQAVDYEAGAMVTHKDRAYVATKAMRSGGEPPNRQGSGWIHMFDSTEVPLRNQP